MQHLTRSGTRGRARQAAHAVGADWLASLLRDLQRDWRLRRTVETLRALDDRTLSDIGLRRENLDRVVRERSRRW
jgi:uncharacterized protein YjiS (DUF1127 family)